MKIKLIKKIKIFDSKFKNKRAFTLIETLVAISILLLSIVGPMTIASRGLYASFYARDEITAFYLAQEGLEYIRNVRDSRQLEDCYHATGTPDNPYPNCSKNDTRWLADFNLCLTNGGGFGCRVDPIHSNVEACEAENCPALPLDFDSSVGTYSYINPHTPSRYTRWIKITPNPDNVDEALVEVNVSWFPEGSESIGTPKVFTLKESLFNWAR